MTDDVIERFNALELGGVIAHSFSFKAGEKLVLRLADPPREPMVNDYELQFNRLLGGHLRAGEGGPGVIKHWRAGRDTDYFAEVWRSRRHLSYGETFTHFELSCETGTFDVIARDFFLTILGKSELVRGSKAPDAGDTPPDMP